MAQLESYGATHWSYHGAGEGGAGDVEVIPAVAGDYYVLLLGGADGYTELTDPNNRLTITVVPAGDGEFATVHVDDHVGAFVLGEPVTVSFADAQNCDSGGDCQWDDWIGIYPVATCCELAQLQNFVGGNGSGEWAYHASGEAGAGTVTVVPTQAVDYYVLLLGGASGYLELTDPDNRLRITVCEAGGCPGAGTASYDLCFGATSADTVTHDFETGSAALPGGWSAVDDTPVSSPGDWYVVDPSTLYGAGIHVDGWAAYENSNVWGNYPGDNQLSGSYLINDAVYDSFIAFRKKALAWSAISDQAYWNARSLPFKYG